MKFKILFFIFISIFSLTSCSQKTNSPQKSKQENFPSMFELPPVEVETLTIMPGVFIKTVETVGELQSPETTLISSDLMGKITYLNIPEGMFVNAGFVIAKVQDTTEQADLSVYEAKLSRAEAFYKRMKALHDEGAISDQRLDDSLEILNIAKGELNNRRSILNKTVIATPFAGVLSLKEVGFGAYLTPGDPIVRISKINPIDLVFSLPEKHLTKIRPGKSVKFKLEGSEKEYLGIVRTIDPYINPEERTVQVKAKVTNNSNEFLPGRFATVSFEIERIPNSILLPQEAIVLEGNTTKVFTVSDSGNEAIEKIVTVSDWNDKDAHITEGLKTGEDVITSGQQKIRNGSKIIPKPYIKINNPNLKATKND